MDQKTGTDVDLLGDPWTEARDPRGRKRHKRSKEVAETVAVLRASGATVEEIAARTVLDEKTLRKYYSRELDKGPALARDVLVEKLWAKAMEGNVSAAKVVLGLLGRGEAQAAKEALDRRGHPATAERQSRPEKLGKKEEAQQAAERIGGKYLPPSSPKLVVSNP